MTAITTAARLLRVAADELKNAHTLGGDWGNEHEALDAYNEHMATATTLEHMARQCLQQIEGPTTLAGTTIEQYARMFNAACEALGKISDCLGIDSDIDPGAEPIIAAIEQLRAGKTHPVLDDRWKARMLDGRAIARDEMGLGDHPELPLLDEGMMPRSVFAALGLELAHTSAEDQLDWGVLGAMSEAVNWTDWLPTPPHGDGWKLVSIFDTEDGPVAWWLRELPEAEDGTTTIRNLQAEVEKLEARIARLSRAGAAPAAVAPLPAVFEQIAQSWDGCMYDAPGETLDIGADIRAAAKRLLAEHPAAVAPQGDEDDSLLLCASDLQHSAIYDSHSEMQDCARSVADRIKALAARALAAPALEAPAALLTKPALVGGGRFGVGVPERYVIEAAQRHHEQEGQREAMTAEQFADEERKRRTLWELIHGPLAAAPQAPAAPSPEGLRAQHDRDSVELRRLCQARDEARRERDLARAENAGLQASTGHLSALVNGQHALLEKAKATMTALHGSASPIDESGGDFDARIPASAFARFVDAHAELLHAMAQSTAAAPAAPAVDGETTQEIACTDATQRAAPSAAGSGATTTDARATRCTPEHSAAAAQVARDAGFNHGVCLALQIMASAGNAGDAEWTELLNCAGREEIMHYARHVETESWLLCGFAAIAAQAKEGGAACA